MSRFDSRKEEPSINELRSEIKLLKEEVREIKSRLHKVEIDALTEQVLRTAHSPKNQDIGSAYDSDTSQSPNYKSNTDIASTSRVAGIGQITKVRPQSSHILIKLVVNDNFVLNKIALLDSGADRNCIVEGLIPTKYLRKGSTKLYSATI